MDDLRLLERVRRGDEGAFAELFTRYKAAVYRYALHLLPAGGQSADDVVQEVFLALLRQLDRFDPARGPLQAYLLGIARRQVLRQSKPWREEPLDEQTAAAASADAAPDAWTARIELVDRVRAAIAELPPVYREAVVLCDLNELDYAAAAAVMECPIGTVRSRLHRARAALASKLALPEPGAVDRA